jgi:hypothetical protein
MNKTSNFKIKSILFREQEDKTNKTEYLTDLAEKIKK